MVGLAIARKLAACGRDVIIVERARSIGSETSSRNSEVIHAGLYYPAEWLKTTLCVRGRHMLYDYCEQRGIGNQRIGKILIAAGDGDVEKLHQLATRGKGNGVTLEDLSSGQMARLEPSVTCRAAVLSPDTGIVDSHALMLSYLGDAERDGAQLVLNTPVTGGAASRSGIILRFGGEEPFEATCRYVVNAAGLWAHRLLAAIDGFPAEAIPDVHYAKGHYFSLAGRSPFNRLIYPVGPGRAHIHVTIDLAGQVRFGPDMAYVDDIDYTVPAELAQQFYADIRHYYPGLKDGALQPAYSGIRPRLGTPGSAADFMFQSEAGHGVPGLLNLFGMDSPGLTSSLAIADAAAELLLREEECVTA